MRNTGGWRKQQPRFWGDRVLDKEIRSAILTLSAQGHSQREIAKALTISRASVQAVLKKGDRTPAAIEKSSQLDSYRVEIQGWYRECKGNMVRVMEKLQEEKGYEVSYSSLTWFCRKNGIGVEPRSPAQRIVTGPGEEMQHDTSPYTIVIGGKKVKRQGASLVLGYSRKIYLQFYPKFDRFHVKIFLTKAFRFFGGVCRQCVIDNASIVIACGAGPDAQVAPEMEAFEKRFGFKFYAHALGHADRSGKVERPFWYVERNFLAGRTFKNDADLNAQALAWANNKANKRTLREFKASPDQLFVSEQPHLVPLPLYIPEVYRIHKRDVDSYSCITMDTLCYPVPPAYMGKTVIVRETEDRYIVMDGHVEVVAHPKRVEGSPLPPSVKVPAHHRQRAHIIEEDKIKERGEPLTSFLEALKKERGSRYRSAVRKLYHLMCQYQPEDLAIAVQRALDHRLFDIHRVETILLQNIAEHDYHLPLGFDDAGSDSPPS
jgi:transposase